MAKAPKCDVSKLPVWARRRIAKLEADLRYERDRLTTIFSKEPSGPVSIALSPHLDPVYLPVEDRIRFNFGPRPYYIDVYLRENSVDSRLEVFGGEHLSVEPCAANHLFLRATDPSGKPRVPETEGDPKVKVKGA